MSGSDGKNDSARFLISYDHETPVHRANVLKFRELLRAEGLDVRIDADADEERQDWLLWMTHEIAAADRVLMVVSPRYRRRFEAETHLGEGSGVEIEAMIVREEIAKDRARALRKFVPVLLPGADIDDIPQLLQPRSATHYRVPELAVLGVAQIVRLLRRGVDGPSAAAMPRAGVSESTGALWLSLTGMPPAAAEDAMATFAAGRAVGYYTSDDAAGALVTAEPAELVALLQRLGRTLPSVLLRARCSYGPRPRVTVGGHVDTGPGAAAAGAQWTAAAPAARRLHAAPRVRVVIAVSPELRATMSAVPRTLLAAYRQFPRDGETGPLVHLSVPGLSRCPDLPPEPGPPLPNQATAGPTVVGDHGRIYVNSVDRSENLHIAAGRDVIMMRDRAR
jgi:hypothetical protein